VPEFVPAIGWNNYFEMPLISVCQFWWPSGAWGRCHYIFSQYLAIISCVVDFGCQFFPQSLVLCDQIATLQ
jgi:hypothetical protein